MSSAENILSQLHFSLGRVGAVAIGVANIIEVQGTILYNFLLLLLPDSILVDPNINIISLEVPYQLWTFHIGSGATGSLGLRGEHTTGLHLVKPARTIV